MTIDVNSPEAVQWTETMRFRSRNEYLMAELHSIKAKAELAKDQAIKARDAANLAVQYAIDAELLATRALLADKSQS
jgi:hypothetical protein